MDNYNQMINNDYNNMVYQNAPNPIPVEQESQPGTDGSMLMAEGKIPEYEAAGMPEQQGYSQDDANLPPQDVLLIQNHQAQLQQSSVIEPAEEYNNDGPGTTDQGNGDVDEPNTENEVNEPKTGEQEEVPGVMEGEEPEKVEGETQEAACNEAEEGSETKAIKEEVEAEESQEPTESTSEPPKPKEPKIDPEQCRACKSTENLQGIFEFHGQQVIANLIKIICPHLNISERDSLPHKICTTCVNKVSMAYEFKQVAEQTDKDFRLHLKRSQNKRRTAQDYILLDAKVALLSSSEDDEDAMMQDDDDFKVSKSEESEESEDSVDSDFKPKKKYYKKKTPSKKKKKPSKPVAKSKKKAAPTPTPKTFKSNVVYIEADDNSENDDDASPPPSKKKKKPTGFSADRSSGGLPCPQCDRVLANGHGLREHLKSHSTEKFTCKLCNKQFKLRLSLDAHMARHREEKERAANAGKAKVKVVRVPQPVVKKMTPSSKPSSSSVASSAIRRDVNRKPGEPTTGKDLFRACAPLTSTYWSDSFSD